MYAVAICALALGCSSHAEPVPTAHAHATLPGREDNVPRDAAPLAQCNDVPLVTLAQIAAGEHAGELVAIDAMPQVDATCTQRRCTHADGSEVACCNRCGGEYQVRLGDALLLQLDVGHCGGMDCDFRCEPFGRKPAHSYRFVGINAFESREKPGAKSTLHVEKYCLLP